MSLRNYLRMNMSRRRQQVFSHGARHSRPANNQHAESLRSSTGPERYPHGGNGRGNAYTRRPNRRHSPTRFSHSHSASSVNTHTQANPQYRSNDYRRRNRRQNQTQSHDRNSALFHLQSQNALQHQYLNVTSNSPSQNLRSSKPSYLPHQICREDLIPNRFECEDQMSFVPPTGPRTWRQPSRRIQEPLLPPPSPHLQYFGQPRLIENEHDIDMTDATEETTDIEMTDAPPIWCDGAQTWINEPTKIVAEGLASVNAVLTRLEWYVRTGNMPVGIVPSTQASLF